jgi:hypothetical protein
MMPEPFYSQKIDGLKSIGNKEKLKRPDLSEGA